MNAFRRVPHDPAALAATRRDLMAKPCEYFRGMFRGRVPSPEEKLGLIDESIQRMASAPIFQNDMYTVQVASHPPFVHLNIRRNDWGPCKDWRHFQEIKNILVGPENEAVELFPAESRLIDTANVYHLWVHSDPTFRFPVGLSHRMVTSEPIGHDRQRVAA
jgi:hypothetical protein